MKDKKIIIFLIVLIVIANFLCIFLIKTNKKQTRNIVYQFTFYENSISGKKYDFKIYEDSLEYIKTNLCSSKNCQDNKEKTKQIKYSKENIEKLKTFIKKLDLKEGTIKEEELSTYEKDVIKSLLYNEAAFDFAIEEYQYKIIYEYNTFIFKENKTIIGEKIELDKDGILTNILTYKIEFSKENIEKIYSFIRENLKSEDNILYMNDTLNKSEEIILNSLIENDETILNNLDDQVNLSYEISYKGINCLTPVLKLYDDNTYKLDNQEVTLKEGNYNLDINPVIQNKDLYEESQVGYYTIKDYNKNTSYKIPLLSTELNEFLNQINVNLTMCVTAY